MMDQIIGSSSHGMRSEEAAAETAKKAEREMPAIHVSGGHVVLAIYGNFSGPINIYKQGEDTISGGPPSTVRGGVS